MASVRIEQRHNLTPADAQKRAEALVADASREYGLKGNWNGPSFEFTGTGVKHGVIAVGENRITIEMDLTFMAMALKGTIEERLRQALSKNFG